MRRFVLLVLLFVLPLQFASAAMVHCDEGKSGPGVHHAARPAAKIDRLAAVDHDQDKADPSSPVSESAHCGCTACHLVAAELTADLAILGPAAQRERYAPYPNREVARAVPRRIERPNWLRAA